MDGWLELIEESLLSHHEVRVRRITQRHRKNRRRIRRCQVYIESRTPSHANLLVFESNSRIEVRSNRNSVVNREILTKEATHLIRSNTTRKECIKCIRKTLFTVKNQGQESSFPLSTGNHLLER